jgi:hypothetical protein
MKRYRGVVVFRYYQTIEVEAEDEDDKAACKALEREARTLRKSAAKRGKADDAAEDGVAAAAGGAADEER